MVSFSPAGVTYSPGDHFFAKWESLFRQVGITFRHMDMPNLSMHVYMLPKK